MFLGGSVFLVRVSLTLGSGLFDRASCRAGVFGAGVVVDVVL